MKITKSEFKSIIKEEVEKFLREEQEMSVEARELYLFITSDGDLYRQQYQPILKNLITKQARGIYDPVKAIKLFMYLVDNGAKKYAKDHGGGGALGPSVGGFDKRTRVEVAKQLVQDFEDEAELGNYDNFLPKKYQKKGLKEGYSEGGEKAINLGKEYAKKHPYDEVKNNKSSEEMYQEAIEMGCPPEWFDLFKYAAQDIWFNRGWFAEQLKKKDLTEQEEVRDFQVGDKVKLADMVKNPSLPAAKPRTEKLGTVVKDHGDGWLGVQWDDEPKPKWENEVRLDLVESVEE